LFYPEASGCALKEVAEASRDQIETFEPNMVNYQAKSSTGHVEDVL
jgi:hypothetical protein